MALAVAVIILFPWRGLIREPRRFHVLAICTVSLMLLWSIRADVGDGHGLHPARGPGHDAVDRVREHAADPRDVRPPGVSREARHDQETSSGAHPVGRSSPGRAQPVRSSPASRTRARKLKRAPDMVSTQRPGSITISICTGSRFRYA